MLIKPHGLGSVLLSKSNTQKQRHYIPLALALAGSAATGQWLPCVMGGQRPEANFYDLNPLGFESSFRQLKDR